MKRILTVLLLCLGLAQIQSARAAETKKLNILWLIGEDFSQHLGCYGTKEVYTPNLDQMAKEGMRYTRAFTTAPVCSASRSAFITGMYQTTIGAQNHRSHRDDGYMVPDGVKPISDWMRAGGYYTANIKDLPPELGFKGTAKTDWNFTYVGKPFDTANWDDLKTHQPFYAQINFSETHRVGRGKGDGPWHSPKKADPAKVELPPIYPDVPALREDWAGYLDAASELDAKIGKILKQLEKDGLADSTMIIFIGDHGMAHLRGKQFCYDDGLKIPMIIRWPKGFPAPKNFKAGTVSDQIIEAIDLTPTSLALAGIPKPPKMQGRVFLGDKSEPAREYAFGARDRCDETVFRFRTVRDEHYRYIKNFMPEKPFFQPNKYKQEQYPAWNIIHELDKEDKLTPWQKSFYMAPSMAPEELYDMEKDPYSMNNLVKSTNPQDQAELKKLRATLDKWITDSDDQGRFPEPPEVAAAAGATKPKGNPNAQAVKEKKKKGKSE